MDQSRESVKDLELQLANHEFHFKIEIVRLDDEHDRLSRELEENVMNRRRLIREIEDLKKRLSSPSS
jgi:hypothetical protein